METLVPCAPSVPVVVVSQALAKAATPQRILRIRDVAALREKYGRQIQEAESEIRKWSQIRLQAERKLGELIRQHVRVGKPEKLSPDRTISLNELGISRNQSSTFKVIAALPERDPPRPGRSSAQSVRPD